MTDNITVREFVSLIPSHINFQGKAGLIMKIDCSTGEITLGEGAKADDAVMQFLALVSSMWRQNL